MAISKTDALALRVMDWSETSQIVWLLTREYGRVHVVAKGSRRPRSHFDGPLEPLVLGEAVFYKKARSTEEGLDILKEFDARETFSGLRKDLGRFYRASYVLELLLQFSMLDAPDAGLFDAAVQILTQLAQGDRKDLDVRLLVFEVNVLAAQGFALSLEECVHCTASLTDKDYRALFDPEAGGMSCGRHPPRRGTFPVAFGTLKSLARLLQEKRGSERARITLGRETLREARTVMDKFFAHRLGKDLVTASFLGTAVRS
jgi:DNA repair protein RecO (recombination protein O)